MLPLFSNKPKKHTRQRETGKFDQRLALRQAISNSLSSDTIDRFKTFRHVGATYIFTYINTLQKYIYVTSHTGNDANGNYFDLTKLIHDNEWGRIVHQKRSSAQSIDDGWNDDRTIRKRDLFFSYSMSETNDIECSSSELDGYTKSIKIKHILSAYWKTGATKSFSTFWFVALLD